MSELFNNVKPGDTVHYSTPQGQYGRGKVVLRYDTHVVINRGKGQPQVVNDNNYVKHERGGKVVGALLSKLAAHDKYLKGVASTKASNAVAKAVSPYKKVGDPQMNASKAFGWSKTNEDAEQIDELSKKTLGNYIKKSAENMDAVSWTAGGTRRGPKALKLLDKVYKRQAGIHRAVDKLTKEDRRAEGPYGGHPYDWDPALRQAIFAGMRKKVGKSTGPKDTGRPYVPTKSGPPPRRGTPSLQGEDASEAEGRGARVAKTKKKKKLHELDNSTLASYVSKSIADRKKLGGMQDQARRIHTPERAAYFVDKAQKKLDKRSKGIKTAVGKIAGNLPAEPLKAHADSEGAKHGGWQPHVAEGTRSEYDANIKMSQGAGKTAKGHYLMRDGRRLSGPHSPEDAVKQYKGMGDSKGVKIVQVKEGVMTDVTTQMLSEDKVKQAAQKAITLAKKAKGNKHVDTQPKLDLVDKGINGPIQADDEGGHNA
jgi:hypothetical protein